MVGGSFWLKWDHMAKITGGICVISYWLTAGCGHTLGQLNNKPSTRPPTRPSPSSPSWSTYITLSGKGLMNEQGSGIIGYFWILKCKSGHRWVVKTNKIWQAPLLQNQPICSIRIKSGWFHLLWNHSPEMLETLYSYVRSKINAGCKYGTYQNISLCYKNATHYIQMLAFFILFGCSLY